MIKKLLLMIPIPTSLGFAGVNVPDDYSNIQDAIDASEDGDSIFVAQGLFRRLILLVRLLYYLQNI